jgi:hypothetical protein
MATTAEFIGVYIADIITTATITIIVATIITITAIGETYRVVAISKLSSLQWLTIANNDGERRSVQSAGTQAQARKRHFRRSLHPSTEEARDGGTRTR